MPENLRRLPPLDLIKGFDAAARHANITQAAAELFLTQSAVSRQIKALEEHLGVTLFHRRARGLALTARGERYHAAVTEALKLLRAAADQVRGEPQTLTVTTTPGIASLWLIPRLAEFARRHRDIDVRISANYEAVDLEHKNIDFAIRYGSTKPPEGIWLFGERLRPVCSPALLNDPKRPLDRPEDLRHHVLLHLENLANGAPWGDWSIWFRSLGMADVEPAGLLRFERYDEVIAAAIAGQGVAPGAFPLLRRQVREGRLVTPFKGSIASPRGYYLLAAAASRERPAARDFAAWVLREAGRHKPSAEDPVATQSEEASGPTGDAPLS
ncbi:MAG: LysR family transcriptional regulator [Burkholderiales bacterium]|nr:LysR family transcriptional regulator [Burkholderiales bacterium]